MFSIVILLVIYMVYKAYADHITYFTVQQDKVPPSFNDYMIFFIADVHRRNIRNSTVQKIKEPIDVVLIGGDFIERHVPLRRMSTNIKKLKQLGAPIYFVWGNNDIEIDRRKIINLLEGEGVILLEDDIISLSRGHAEIQLIGLNYYDDNDLDPAIDWSRLEDGFTILLTHKPSSYYKLENEYKQHIDLILAGHTHGGQIRIAGFGFYEKGGIFSDEHACLIITEGYGFTLLPFRLETKAECHVISLKSTL